MEVKEEKIIDVSNLTSEEFVQAMHDLDEQNTCPCVRCEKCQVRMQRHECDAFKKWAFRHIVKG